MARFSFNMFSGIVFSSVRENERRDTWLALITLFGLLTGHALLETARDALFLSRLPPSRLPWVYLAIALIALSIAAGQRRFLRDREARVGLIGLSLLAAAMSFLFWLIVGRAGSWALFGLYTWTGVLVTLIAIQFWSAVSDLFDVRQAKRLFVVIGIGGVLGAIAGSALARVLTMVVEVRDLLLAAALVFVGAAVGPVYLRSSGVRPPREMERSETSVFEPLRLVWTRPYLKRLAFLVLVSTVCLTLVDYIFKSVVARNVPATELGAVFSGTYLVINVLSLIAQLFLVRSFTRSMELSRMLAVLPALLGVAVLGVLFGGGLVAVYLLKGVDGALRHSLHRTASEVLYVPLSARLRQRVKSFIDVVGQRGGQALASLAILGVVALGSELTPLAIVVVLLSATWILLAYELRPHYLDLFRADRGDGTLPSQIEFPELDLASLESLISALNSGNDAEVLAALDLLEQKERVRLVPALILYHPSSSVVRRALELFSEAGREDYLPIAERLSGHVDPHVRSAILRARGMRNPDPDVFRDALIDPSPVVQATGLAGLMTTGELSDDAVQGMLDAMLDDAGIEGKVALAETIASRPDPVFRNVLGRLADDPDPRVQLSAARAIRASGDRACLPRLLPMLTRRELRDEARTTIRSFGADVLPDLESALGDQRLPSPVRLHLPRTIAQFNPVPASAILLRRLVEETDGAIRFKILRVLGMLKFRDPDLPLDDDILDRAIRETLEATFRLLDWRLRLEAGARDVPARGTEAHRLLVDMLVHKERHAMERLFRLLQLRHPEEDLKRIHRDLAPSGQNHGGRRPGADSALRAGSRELLEHALKPPIRTAVMGLVDDLPDAERLAAAGEFLAPTDAGYEQVLHQLLDRGGTSVASVVVYHVAELGLRSFQLRLQHLDPDSEILAGALARALPLLSGPL